MLLHATTPHLTGSMVAAIGWLYLVTNSARVFSYIPQILVVWRCTDGARAISLFTWGSWMVSHAASIAYGALVVHDALFVVISTINLTCCTAVVIITARRRGLLGDRERAAPGRIANRWSERGAMRGRSAS